MPTPAPDVSLSYGQKTGPGTVYYRRTRYGWKTKTYRKIKRHARNCRA